MNCRDRAHEHLQGCGVDLNAGKDVEACLHST
jgi:hypothetical protein